MLKGKFVHMMGKVCLCIILLLCTLATITGEELNTETELKSIRLDLVDIQDGIRYFRYQINGEKMFNWESCEVSDPHMTIEVENRKESNLYLQQSYNNIFWSPSSLYRYDVTNDTWKRILEEKTKGEEAGVLKERVYLETETVASMPFGSYGEYYQMGVGAQVELNKLWSAGMRTGAMVEYQYGFSETDRVAVFHEVTLMGTAGYQVITTKLFNLVPELGVGVMLHMPVGVVGAVGEEGLKLYADFAASAGVKIEFNGKGNNFYTVPRVVLFPEDGNVGVLGELSIGTTVEL